jgi:hypothetical protein
MMLLLLLKSFKVELKKSKQGFIHQYVIIL